MMHTQLKRGFCKTHIESGRGGSLRSPIFAMRLSCAREGAAPCLRAATHRQAPAPQRFCKNLKPFFSLLLAACLSAQVGAMDDGKELALALGREGQHHLAALEYRRLAQSESETATVGHWYWLAAHEYAAERDWPLTARMLDLAEDAAADGLAVPVNWLRAEQALAQRDWASAGFYFQSLQTATDDEAWRDFAVRGEAAARLRSGDLDGARAGLHGEPLEAVERYAARTDKSPRIGGLLGLVPGLGYLYSGETGNAVRSLLLNGLFIWGMVETAEEDQWSVFTLLTLVEFTWYSGSIYGGLDAANRHNRERLDTAVETVRGDQRPRPNLDSIPLFTLGFEF